MKNLTWFFGIVEEIDDPRGLGRVQVRCFGYHTSDENKIPSELLPWATVMAPTTSASYRGINTPIHALMIGSTVFGFFIDGEDAQYPMIVGSIPGMTPPPQEHVSDKQNTDYDDDTDWNYNDNIPDVDVILGTEMGKSYIEALKAAEVTDINTAIPPNLSVVDGDFFSDSFYEVHKWDLPKARGGSDSGDYLNNRVIMSTSGHIDEVDDSPDNERLMKYHTTGTYQEFDAAGSLVTRVVGDNYEVIMKDNNVYVQGDVNLTTKGNVRQLVTGNYYLEVYGDYTENIHGNKKVKVSANYLKEVGAHDAIAVGASKYVSVVGEAKTSIGNGWKQYGGGDYDITVGGLAPCFAVKTAGLPGIGLIQMESNGTVDIIGQLGAAIKGVITTIGDPTIPLSTTTINGKSINIGTLDANLTVLVGNHATTTVNSINAAGVISLDAATSLFATATTSIGLTTTTLNLDASAVIDADAPAIHLN